MGLRSEIVMLNQVNFYRVVQKTAQGHTVFNKKFRKNVFT